MERKAIDRTQLINGLTPVALFIGNAALLRFAPEVGVIAGLSTIAGLVVWLAVWRRRQPAGSPVLMVAQRRLLQLVAIIALMGLGLGILSLYRAVWRTRPPQQLSPGVLRALGVEMIPPEGLWVVVVSPTCPHCVTHLRGFVEAGRRTLPAIVVVAPVDTQQLASLRHTAGAAGSVSAITWRSVTNAVVRDSLEVTQVPVTLVIDSTRHVVRRVIGVAQPAFIVRSARE